MSTSDFFRFIPRSSSYNGLKKKENNKSESLWKGSSSLLATLANREKFIPPSVCLRLSAPSHLTYLQLYLIDRRLFALHPDEFLFLKWEKQRKTIGKMRKRSCHAKRNKDNGKIVKQIISTGEQKESMGRREGGGGGEEIKSFVYLSGSESTVARQYNHRERF